MCCLRNIALESVTLESVTDRRADRQTDRPTDDRQSDPYVSLCFAGDTKMGILFSDDLMLLAQPKLSERQQSLPAATISK